MSKHEYQGVQFDAAKVAGIAQEVIRQKAAKRDFVYPVSKLGYTDEGLLILKATEKAFAVGGRCYLDWAEAEAALDGLRAAGDQAAKIEVQAGCGEIPLTKTAFSQLCSRMEVPAAFAKGLATKGHKDLQGHLFRELLARDKRKFLVRTLDGSARAVLSDRFKLLDNGDLFFAAAETFQEAKAQLWNARLWEDGFELFGVAEHISGEVRTDRPFNPGDGWLSRWYGKEGDVQNAAVKISNSETGQGGLNVKLSILRRVCQNFCVYADGVASRHFGKSLEAGDDLLVSDETREKEGAWVWSKVRDAIRTAFNAEKFAAFIAGLNEATQQVVEKPQAAVDNIVAEYQITEDRKAAILESLLSSGDKSRYGVIQAVTWAAHEASPEEASKLEVVGGALASMSAANFDSLVAAK